MAAPVCNCSATPIIQRSETHTATDRKMGYFNENNEVQKQLELPSKLLDDLICVNRSVVQATMHAASDSPVGQFDDRVVFGGQAVGSPAHIYVLLLLVARKVGGQHP